VVDVRVASSESEAALSATQLHLQRGQKTQAQVILCGDEQCNIHLPAGKLCHLTGKSGSGKSTLLLALARLYPLGAGNLRWHGRPHSSVSVATWRCEVGLLPQTPVMLAGTVAENLRYPVQLTHQQQRLSARNIITDDAALSTLLDKLDLDIPLNRAATELSGGQQARLALARLLLTEPDVILADEPLAGLDAHSATQVMQCLRAFCRTGGAVLMTAHTHATVLDADFRYEILPTQQLHPQAAA